MDLKTFNNSNTTEKYEAINRATVRALQDLGGKASRDEIIERIRNYDPIISQEIVDHKKKAKKTGNYYSEFRIKFGFNLSTHLRNRTIIEAEPKVYQLSDELLKLDPDSPNFEEDILKLERENPKSTLRDAEAEQEDEDMQDSVPEWRKELKERLFKLDPYKFETLCKKLLSNMNVDIDDKIGMSYTNDGGVDGFGYLETDELRTERIAIQAKRWAEDNLVSSPEIDKFRGAMDKYNAEYGVFITTSDFTRGAIKSSRSGTRMITLINGEKLMDLIVKYQVYVHPSIVIEDFYK